MTSLLVKNKLIRAVEKAAIPSKEKVLPLQAFTGETTIKNLYGPILLKAVSLATATVVIISAFAFGGVKQLFPSNSGIFGVPNASESPGDKPEKILITANAPDTFGSEDKEIVMKRNEVYISPVLKEQMKKHQGVDALFRVIVELAITDEDYQEYKPTVSNEEALKALKKKEDAAWAAYDAALTELQGISDEDFRAALAEKITEKERQAREISRQYSKLSSEDQTAYYSSIVNNRLEYAHSVGAQKVMSITDSSDMVSYVASQGHAYFMALSQDMINGMANRGGYLFRLAPPERKEGYDPKVSDYLTNVLNGRPKDEVFHVAVVCAADRYNRFAWERNITVNREYNFAGFRPWQGAPSPAMSWKEYSASVAAYVNEVVERNGLIEKRVINPDVLDAYIDESVFNNYRYRDGSSPEYVNAITVGFEVNATKKEIMSLVKDEDVKVIYSMTFSLEDRSGISDNE